MKEKIMNMTIFKWMMVCVLSLAASVAIAGEPVVHRGDVAWMLTSTLLVTMMTIPGVALFYGGMVRSKNVLSVLVQVIIVFSLISVLWAIYGYSFTFTEFSPVIGGGAKLFLQGVNTSSLSDTFTADVKLPEYVFFAFQGAFAAITCTLVLGAFAERIKFSALLMAITLWFTFSYLPIAHMVWGPGGYLLKLGALDFAGGTVVHINSGVAGLVAAYVIGRRIGFGRESMMPHSLPLTMLGGALLWVGWFGFNAGSNLEATGGAALAFVNTLIAASAATLSWSLFESWLKKKPSLLGAVSGSIAGLVAITPACGTVGPMGALAIGFIGGVVCLWGVTQLKRWLKIDDSLDAFGVHGVGGIFGSLLTGVFTAPSLGGTGAADFDMMHQLGVQAMSVMITIVISAVMAFIAFKLVDMAMGLRVTEEQEREGLDVSSHGEAGYRI